MHWSSSLSHGQPLSLTHQRRHIPSRGQPARQPPPSSQCVVPPSSPPLVSSPAKHSYLEDEIIEGAMKLFLPQRLFLGSSLVTPCSLELFGQFAAGIGNTDVGFVLGTGATNYHVYIRRRDATLLLANLLLAKDLILQIIGEISVSAATYKWMEFVGSIMEERIHYATWLLELVERMGLCLLMTLHLNT